MSIVTLAPAIRPEGPTSDSPTAAGPAAGPAAGAGPGRWRPGQRPEPTLVVGVDTHRDTHSAVLIDALGRAVAEQSLETDPDGFQELFDLVCASALTVGDRYGHQDLEIIWAIEGSNSYGASLREFIRDIDPEVVIVEAYNTPRPRGAAKNDIADAEQIARHTLRQLLDHRDHLQRKHSQPHAGRTGQGTVGGAKRGRAQTHPPATAREGDMRAVLEMLLVTRAGDVAQATRLSNRFTNYITTKAPAALRAQLTGLSTTQRLKKAAAWRVATVATIAVPTGHDSAAFRMAQAKTILRDLARAIVELHARAKSYEQAMTAILNVYAAPLLALAGVGPISAAQALITFSHPGRIHSEAGWAAIAGVAPLAATSGQSGNRHRLNRHGDRHLNAAIHRIVLTRRRCNAAGTGDYVARRTAEGKSLREITRCLKRYVARELYRTLMTLPRLP